MIRHDNSYSGQNLGCYHSLESVNQIYIKIDSLDIGSFPASEKAILKAYVGPRKAYLPFSFEFHKNQALDHIWNFNFKNADRSSFVIALFKKRYFGSDREIGEIEIKLNAFEFNKVTTHEFTLQSPNPNAVPAKIRVSVHLSDKCTVPFHAPVGQIAIKNFQILHAKTYLPK